MIFRNGNVKVKCGKVAIQAGRGKRRKRNRSSLNKDTKCQIENFKRTSQKGPLTERENGDTWKEKEIMCFITSSLGHPGRLLEKSTAHPPLQKEKTKRNDDILNVFS